MPLYEFECVTCRNQVLDSLKLIEKAPNLKTIKSVLKKYSQIKAVILVDLIKEEEICSAGKLTSDLVDIDLYIEDGKKMVLFSVDDFRFSELILDKEDEKNVECSCCEKGKVEKVISSFSYTSDLSTDPPKPPGMKDLPKEIRGKLAITDYIEEKDRPHNIKADNRYKHQYQDKSRKKIL